MKLKAPHIGSIDLNITTEPLSLLIGLYFYFQTNTPTGLHKKRKYSLCNKLQNGSEPVTVTRVNQLTSMLHRFFHANYQQNETKSLQYVNLIIEKSFKRKYNLQGKEMAFK